MVDYIPITLLFKLIFWSVQAVEAALQVLHCLYWMWTRSWVPSGMFVV